MFEIIAFMTVRQRIADEARSALPTSPVRADRRGVSPRLRASAVLRRLADRLEPSPGRPEPAMADCR